jgi:phospholipase/carboxylesterase
VENRHLSRRQFFLSSFAATFSTTLLLSAKAHTISASGNQSDSLKFISVPPENGGMPAGVIVCLHGSGAKSQALVSLARSLNLPDFLFLFPDAPFPDPSVPGGKIWYDLKSSTHKGLGESRQRLVDWLKSLETITNLPLESTILSGFSQGAAMTLDVGLMLPLAGLVSLSGYLHSPPQLIIKEALPPVLMVQGKQDKIVTLDEAHFARDSLEALGVAVKYEEFDMGHELKPAELALMRRFVVDVM